MRRDANAVPGDDVGGKSAPGRAGRGQSVGGSIPSAVAVSHIFVDYRTAFNALSLYLSLSLSLSRLLRLLRVIFRACSMFRSAAPISRSLSLSFCAHTCICTYTQLRALSSPPTPPRCRSPSFSFRFLLLRPSYDRDIRQRVLYDHANLSKKFVRLFKVNNSYPRRRARHCLNQ